MPGLSFQKITSLCELLNSTLKPQLKDLPHLQDESTQLDVLIAKTKSLDGEQQGLIGRLREITRLRREAETEGQDLRSRVAAQIRGKLGFKNENLIAFGIPPRKRTRKKGEKTTPPPTPETPPPATQTPAAPPAAGATPPAAKP
jgi:hypothetical protein